MNQENFDLESLFADDEIDSEFQPENVFAAQQSADQRAGIARDMNSRVNGTEIKKKAAPKKKQKRIY